MDVSIFNPPENFMAEADMLLWPTITDQIDLIRSRQEQIGRVLSFYKGSERDYATLKRENDILSAVTHTLCAVRELCNNNRVHADAST